MASTFRPLSVIFIVIAVLFLPNAVNSIPAEEFDFMLDTLRVRGYDLVCNAIVTSDLQFELVSRQNDTGNRRSFTIFAPVDSSLFALDMTQTASSYTDSLRFHVIPLRLSMADLERLPAGTSLPTLLPHLHLNVTRNHDSGLVTVSGVTVAFPGLFYGRDVAVHGLAGIISLRSTAATRVVSGPPLPAVSPVDSSGRHSFPPRTVPHSSKNDPVMAPSPSSRPAVSRIPVLSSFNVTHRGGSPPVEITPPVNPKAHASACEIADADSHSHAASPFHCAAYPPEPEELDSPATGIIHAPEEGHSYAASPFNGVVHPSEPEESDSLVNQMIHAREDSHSLAPSPVTHGISPASPTESPANIYDLPPVVSHAFTPPSESPEYRHSSISAPPLEYSGVAVPVAMSPDVWLPNKLGVTLIETFIGGFRGNDKNGAFVDELP